VKGENPVAETLYDMYCRIAEMSGEKPLGKDELAGAWMQDEFDRASERLAEVVRKQWQIELHPTLCMGLDTLTDDMLDYLHKQGTHYWVSEGHKWTDPWEGIAILYIGCVEDLRLTDNIYVLVPDEELANNPGGDQIVAISEAKLMEVPHAEGRGPLIFETVRDDEGNVIGSRQTRSRGQEHHLPEDDYDDYAVRRAFESAERRKAWDTGELERAISDLRRQLDDPERPLEDDG
jgi:hypothetical protein